MNNQYFRCAAGASAALMLCGCASPFDQPRASAHRPISSTQPEPRSIYRTSTGDSETGDGATRGDQTIDESSIDSFIVYAMEHSAEIESAYQRWRAASEESPQVGALPDPKLSAGFFLDEVETRVGPQQARVGIEQTFPWIGKLRDRKDAASRAALAAWYEYQGTRLRVGEQVVSALEDLAYLDSAIRITRENKSLLGSFEGVVRARYRVSTGSHPELIRVQLELAQLDDRVTQLSAMRPSYVASLNAVLNRSTDAPIGKITWLPDRIVSGEAESITALAHEWSPELAAMEENVARARIETKIAQDHDKPDLTVGLDYIITDDAANPSLAESGDDPIMLRFGINLPIWREKYDAEVRQSIARRLSMSRELDAASAALDAQIYRAWFEHTDADRRMRLYERSLIPKAQESLSSSLAGFRTGDSAFLDLLDTERTLLEFSIAAARARADRGKALARLNRLAGIAVPTSEMDQPAPDLNPGDASERQTQQ